MTVLLGECLATMRTLPSEIFDSCVTDPPYGLAFMGKRWDYDVPSVEIWAEVLRVMKPGAYLLAFAGTRTYHRICCRIEDAGFEIRDMIAWVYGSGFPKSHNGDWGGTALKPAHEPIVMARKPMIGTTAENFAAYGTGGLWIDACRVGTAGGTSRSGQAEYPKNADGTEDRSGSWARTGHAIVELDAGRYPANLIHDGSDEVLAAFPDAKGQLATASTSDTLRAGQNTYGKMARGSTGQEPRNDAGSAARFFYCAKASKSDRNDGCDALPKRTAGMVSNTSGQHITRRDPEYVPPTQGNHHPTVKPTELMRYLCRLVTPLSGLILDPFAGSGSTGRGAALEGFEFIGIEQDAEYVAIANARIAAAQARAA